MHKSERLSRLIGDIYDAALDSNLWVDVLGRTGDFVGCSSAGLGWKDVTAKRGDIHYESEGVDPYYRQLYFEKYVKLDPCTVGQFFADVGQPVITTDLMPYEEFVQTRIYKEWAKPQSLIDCAMTVLDRSTTAMSFLALFRHRQDGFFDDDALRRVRLIVPHFRRAVLIGNLIDLKKAEAASFADTLDGVRAGMFLVDATGRIVHANAAGHVMLDAADVLHAEAGRLAVNDRRADQVLADTFATAGNGDAAIGIKGVAVPLVARDGERYVAHVLPLTSGARQRAGVSYAAAAALFVHKAALDTPSPPEAVAKAYKLTPMELRVLLAVVEIGGVPEVAEALGIAETTVRTHLHQTYQKTGVNRQADLVKLVAAFSNPLLK
jgi:DNA-binding CsgD family transcriptional regulator/PAS domain-containing protein